MRRRRPRRRAGWRSGLDEAALERRAPLARLRPARAARPGGRPAGAGHPRLPRHRPHDDWRCAGARRGGLAGARVGAWGWNSGARTDTLEQAGAALDAIGANEPILVVGWSLGGLFARELARTRPEQVRAVVTLGSPFSGDPQPEQCVAAVRVGRGPQGRRAADPAHHRQAAGAAPCDLVARGRDHRAARGPRTRRRTRRGGRAGLHHMAFAVSRTRGRAKWCAKSTAS